MNIINLEYNGRNFSLSLVAEFGSDHAQNGSGAWWCGVLKNGG